MEWSGVLGLVFELELGGTGGLVRCGGRGCGWSG